MVERLQNGLKRFDPVVFWLAIVASVIGIVIIFDAGYARNLASGKGVVPREAWVQVATLVLACAGGLWLASLPIKAVYAWTRTLWLVSLVALALVLVPGIGTNLNGASRWFKIGPILVQPAEFAKLSMVFYLAAVLHHWKAWPKSLPHYKTLPLKIENVYFAKLRRLWPGFVAMIGIGLIVIEPDLGTGAVLWAVAWLMFAVGGVSRKSIFWGTLACCALVLIAVKLEPYRIERITNHLHRWDEDHVDDSGFQTVQSELALASGGWLGVGVGAGRAKHIMPAATTDFVAATIGEEFGFFGWCVLMLPLGGLSVRCFQLARTTPTKFGSLVMIGVGSWFGVQTVINTMMANGALPAIGIPLPFYSSGGSSLIALWLALGLSQAVRQPILAKTEATGETHRNGWGDGRTRLSGA